MTPPLQAPARECPASQSAGMIGPSNISDDKHDDETRIELVQTSRMNHCKTTAKLLHCNDMSLCSSHSTSLTTKFQVTRSIRTFFSFPSISTTHFTSSNARMHSTLTDLDPESVGGRSPLNCAFSVVFAQTKHVARCWNATGGGNFHFNYSHSNMVGRPA